MLLGSDIWGEITTILADQSDESTLLALALSSRTLASTCALPALWRHVSSLHKIIQTINASPPDNDPIVICKQSEDEAVRKKWMLSRPLPDTVRVRIIEYLSHVRSYTSDSDGDEVLWPLLPKWLRLDGPLFPNLQSLTVLNPTQNLEGPHAEAFLPLVSPSIRNLKIKTDNEGPTGTRIISSILDMVKTQECSIRKFEYSGPTCPDLLPASTAFRNLKSLSIICYNFQRNAKPPQTSIFDLLSSFPTLTSFSCVCNPTTYKLPAQIPSSPVSRHDSLTHLSLFGSMSGIERALMRMKLPSLTHLYIASTSGHFTQRREFMRTIANYSPILRSLEIKHVFHDALFPSFDDLTPLLGLPLETFECRVDEEFTVSEVETILKAWPHLQNFTLLKNGTPYNAAQIYSAIAQYPSLKHLNVPVDLAPLLSPFEMDQPLFEERPNPRLESLSIEYAKNLPTQEEETRTLAKNLIQIFPDLARIEQDISDLTFVHLQRDVMRWAGRVIG